MNDSRQLRSLRWFTRTDALVAAMLLVAIPLVFGQTLTHDFVNFDDHDYVVNNPHVHRGVTVAGVGWAFTHRYFGHWHPLTWVSHMVDCQLFGTAPWGHHLVSLILHALASMVFYCTLRSCMLPLWRCAAVAMLFAVHPLRAESVAWVAERKDVLSGLFFTLTLWAYVAYAKRPFSGVRYLLVVALFCLGLMSKAMLVTLPMLLLLLDYWPLERFSQGTGSRRAAILVLEKLPLLAISVSSSLLAVWAQGGTVIALEQMGMAARLLNVSISYVAYLGMFFFPHDLAVFYPHRGSHQQVWQAIAALALLIGITAWAFALRRKCPAVLVGWLWYLGTFVPVIGLVQVGGQGLADRFTYLPQMGLVIAVAWLPIFRHRRLVAAIASVGLVVLLCTGWQQVSYWRDSETLWRRTVACTPANPIVLNNLAGTLIESKKYEEAAIYAQKALTLDPSLSLAYANRGDAKAAQGRLDEAIADYETTVQIRPDYFLGQKTLAELLLRRGRVAEAAAHYRAALELRPDLAAELAELARTLQRSK